MQKLGKKLLYFELFGEQVSFNIDGQKSHRSVIGLIMSLIIFIVVCNFGRKKFDVMIKKEDTRYQSYIEENGLN